MRYTYSRWDGTQALDELDPEALIEALTDDVLATGDVDAAIDRLTWRAVDRDVGESFSAARDLVEAFVRERERLRHAHRAVRERQSRAADSLARPDTRWLSGGEESDTEASSHDWISGQRPDTEPTWQAVEDGFRSDPGDGVGAGERERRQPTSGESVQMAAPARAILRHGLGAAMANPTGRADLDRLADDQASAAAGSLAAPASAGRPVQSCAGALDALEDALLGAHRGGGLHGVGVEQLERVLGRGTRELLARLLAIPEVLTRAGYIEVNAAECQLTARGMRRIGQSALTDIFRGIESWAPGDHPAVRGGVNGTDPDGHKRYDAESDFLLDLNRTLLNAVARGGPVRPVELTVDDFEVMCTERTTQASTVLMLDVSPSMALRGCLAAGRKVALALNALIERRFPRDRLQVVALSGHARVIRAEAILRLPGGTHEYGTNLQHGLLLARRLLARHRGGRQIIVITDGEPTAHLEGNRAHFAYPPTARTRAETLREVRRCTRDDIVINTFMLDRTTALTDFVDDVTRINRGRAFYTTPERLGEYVLVDYVRNRRGF